MRASQIYFNIFGQISLGILLRPLYVSSLLSVVIIKTKYGFEVFENRKVIEI